MEITLWGTRGSVPVSGTPFLRHGGCTTCVTIDVDDETIVIDCGTGLAELGKSNDRSWRNTHVLQTHLHWDHVQGFPFFGPLFDAAASFRFWAVDRDGISLREVLDGQMSKPTFPVGLDVLPATLAFETLAESGARTIGDACVRWTEMSHPSGSTAYRIDHAGGSFVFSGDVEAAAGGRDELVGLARDADVLLMDAQYFPDEYATRHGWGHSTPLDAVSVALDAGVGRLVLTHHDPAHDDARLEAKLALARRAASGAGLLVDNAFDRMRIVLGRDGTAAAA